MHPLLGLVILAVENMPTNGDGSGGIGAGGVAGWTCAGLLNGVLGWLMFKHLPDTTRQQKELLESKDKQITELVLSFEKRLDAKDIAYGMVMAQQRVDFKAALDTVVDHCEKESEHNTQMMTTEFKQLRNSIDALTSRINGSDGHHRGIDNINRGNNHGK